MKNLKGIIFILSLIAISSIQIDMLPIACQNTIYILLAVASVVAFKKVIKFIKSL